MRASILGVCFVLKKIPKGPILCFKTPYVSYMKYLRSSIIIVLLSASISLFQTRFSSRFSRSVFTNTFKNGFLFRGRDLPNLP